MRYVILDCKPEGEYILFVYEVKDFFTQHKVELWNLFLLVMLSNLNALKRWLGKCIGVKVENSWLLWVRIWLNIVMFQFWGT